MFNGHGVSSIGSPLLISDHQSLYLKAHFLIGNLTVCIFLEHWPSSPPPQTLIIPSLLADLRFLVPLAQSPPLSVSLCLCLRVRMEKNKGKGYESNRKLNCTEPPKVQIDILYFQKDYSSL